MMKFFFGLLTIVILASPGSVDAQTTSGYRPGVLFLYGATSDSDGVVSKDTASLIPIAIITSGKLEEPNPYTTDAKKEFASQQRFIKHYYDSDSAYVVASDGVIVDALHNVKAEPPDTSNEERLFLEARLPASKRITLLNFVDWRLAGSRSLFSNEAKRSGASISIDTAGVFTAAKKIFRSKTKAQLDLEHFEEEQVAASNLGTDTNYILATFLTEFNKKGKAYALFMILREQQKSLVPEYVNLQEQDDESSPMLGGFIGEFNIDNDPTNEIVVRNARGEVSGVAIMKRLAGKWKVVYHYYYSG